MGICAWSHEAPGLRHSFIILQPSAARRRIVSITVPDGYRNNEPLEWTRVHDLPDFVYFNHSIHVAKGIGCQTCHGQVDQMPLMWKENTLNMEWCLECHRAPEKFIRPREEVFNMTWKPAANQEEVGRQLVEEYQVRKVQLTDCSVCHN